MSITEELIAYILETESRHFVEFIGENGLTYDEAIEADSDIDHIYKTAILAEQDLVKHWARMCSVLKVGMNEGFVYCEGEMYFSTVKVAADFLRKVGYPTNISDEEVIHTAYEEGVMYLTNWDDPDDFQYIEYRGKLWSE